MSGPLSMRFSTQAQVDIRRISTQLTDLQRQVASGAAANDLLGFAGASSRLLSAQSSKANAEARASVISQLQARLGVQGAALGQAADAAGLLAQSIREAVSANDGRGIGAELEMSFASVVSALNESWNGQPMFAGERQGSAPIRITTLDELQTVSPDAVFDEAARHQTLDLGTGTPIVIAKKASELAGGMFDTLRDLANLLDAAGGAIGQPIDAADRTALLNFAAALDAEAAKFTTEEGRAGQLQSRFEAESTRLQIQSDLLTKEIGEQADADLAAVSVQMSALLVQYEAAAKTFSELSKLNLLQYL